VDIELTKAVRTRANSSCTATRARDGATDRAFAPLAALELSAAESEMASETSSHRPNLSAKDRFGSFESATSAMARSARQRISLELLKLVRGKARVIPIIDVQMKKGAQATTKLLQGQLCLLPIRSPALCKLAPWASSYFAASKKSPSEKVGAQTGGTEGHFQGNMVLPIKASGSIVPVGSLNNSSVENLARAAADCPRKKRGPSLLEQAREMWSSSKLYANAPRVCSQ
jgi:hypothetical protein